MDREPKDDRVSREEFEVTGKGEAFGEADWNSDGVLIWEEYFGTMTGRGMGRGEYGPVFPR